MKPEITAALIGAGATILAALIGLLGVFLASDVLSSRTRIHFGIEKIKIMNTTWAADFKFEDGSDYTKEVVTFEKWTKNTQFEGHGEVVHSGKQYRYPITGEVSPARIVVLDYKAEDFPTEANIGTACLQLNTSGDGLDGFWSGLVSTKQAGGKEVSELRSGTVSMKKIK